MVAVCALAHCCGFFEQKTAYEISTRDWSSDVCSSDLAGDRVHDSLHPAVRGTLDTRGKAQRMAASNENGPPCLTIVRESSPEPETTELHHLIDEAALAVRLGVSRSTL